MMSVEETRKRLDQIRGAISNSADYMPTHREFIAKNCAA
jgi:tryptophan halogenase